MFIKKSCWQQDIRTEEYVLAAVKGTVLAGTAGYLFYDTWIVVLLVLPSLYFYLQAWQEEQCRKKEEEFREQFKEGIKAMAAALNVG